MIIKEILTENRTLAKADWKSKKRALEKLAQIFSDEQPDIAPGELFQSLINRERLGSTGIGGGIAIPHCRFNTGGKTLGACVSLAEPIDFDAVDNEPIDLMFAMVVPQEAEKDHLETLANLAEKMQHPSYVSQLRQAQDNAQLFEHAIKELDH